MIGYSWVNKDWLIDCMLRATAVERFGVSLSTLCVEWSCCFFNKTRWEPDPNPAIRVCKGIFCVSAEHAELYHLGIHDSSLPQTLWNIPCKQHNITAAADSHQDWMSRSLEVTVHLEWCSRTMFSVKPITALIQICPFLKALVSNVSLLSCTICTKPHQIMFPITDHVSRPRRDPDRPTQQRSGLCLDHRQPPASILFYL